MLCLCVTVRFSYILNPVTNCKESWILYHFVMPCIATQLHNCIYVEESARKCVAALLSYWLLTQIVIDFWVLVNLSGQIVLNYTSSSWRFIITGVCKVPLKLMKIIYLWNILATYILTTYTGYITYIISYTYYWSYTNVAS